MLSPIKQRLLEAIERTPEPLLEQTLTFLEFLTSRTQSAAPDFDSDFDSDTDSNDQILADLKASLHQASSGQTFPISELWDGINTSFTRKNCLKAQSPIGRN
ncbi:hypothetical protein K4039_27620 [Lyngbya sp. CCAP 1446/10]|uniref:hypothetical protein n=1 Tax=Lyngbya sp. CCAP 1446/10 TaxID=439293 RepID=UPI0022374C14|nr:hypothetical protein [Lyngbya sp. CCAP 1446/10]MCW6053716.1 hypothetical protein [Lyngbya sp. CCAP 1446/10]